MKHVDTVYGKSILKNELQLLDKYVVITMEEPWEIYAPFFQYHPPQKVIMVNTLDKDSLDSIYQTSLDIDDSIVGLGGGTALDAAKYFAHLNNKHPLLVPSITSTNAPFSDFISIRKNGSSYGFKIDGYPKKVLIDYELIQLAAPRLNRAGYGDLLYMQTALNDWLIMHAKAIGPPVDRNIKETIYRMIGQSIENAAEIGSMTEEGIRMLMEYTEHSYEIYMQNSTLPISAGSEHLFAWNLELITQKQLIHGEIVSLGIVISSYLQSNYMMNSRYIELRDALNKAQVIYHPDQIGITWDEIVESLKSVEVYNLRFRHFHTIFELMEWTPKLLNRLKEYIYKSF
jgi:glycerol-1-phosphate dehydrogenase [NAD(P)+]